MTYKPAWANAGGDIGCRVYHSVGYTIPKDVATVHPFDSERYDTDGMHSNVTNNSRITFTTAGKYSLIAVINFAGAANNVGDRTIRFRKNGTDTIAIVSVPALGGLNFDHEIHLATVDEFAANDYVEVLLTQGEAFDLATEATPVRATEFMARKLSKAG